MTITEKYKGKLIKKISGSGISKENIERLKEILTNKNIQLTGEETFSELIEKINEFEDIIIAPPPELYLYNAGDLCTDVTGGWINNSNDKGPYDGGRLAHTQNSDHIYMAVSSYNRSCGAMPANTIDLTHYTKLHINFDASGMNSSYYRYIKFIVARNSPPKSGQTSLASPMIFYNNGTNITVTVNVTNINEPVYLYLYIGEEGSSSSIWFKLRKMWLSQE